MGELLQNYLNKQLTTEALITELPEKDLQLVVIIPAYNEPEIIKTLVSLKDCTRAKFPSEVIILINHSNNAPIHIIEQNTKTYHEVLEWIKHESSQHLKFYCIFKGDFPEKHAGVGLARKTLMDEAIRRFTFNNNELGIIASFDADSLVSNNYLADIQNAFIRDKKLNCTLFYFEHKITSELSEKNKNAIVLYELYLRYFRLALKYTGFPYAFHTVGSCFAVKASAYSKQGGMSKRQAGEDFYFLHKIFPLGNCIELNNVIVYPSSRPSDRVPFGTGNAVKKILESNDFLTYNPIYFTHLKTFFSTVKTLLNVNGEVLKSKYLSFDASIQSFISFEEFETKINELNNNCASEKAFIHRFYQWFDAFKIIKYLNFIHCNSSRSSIIDAVRLFIEMVNTNAPTNKPIELLNILKEMELN